MSEAIIRDAHERDVPELRRIAKAAWAPIYDYFREQMGEDLYRREHPGDPLERKADSVEDFFHRHPQWVIVTEVAGEVVGFLTYTLGDNGVGEISNNAVDPAMQGRGLGSLQYAEVLRRMEEAGMKYAKVTTGLDPAHAAARRAYEKVGFRQVRPSVTYYREL